MSRVVVLGAFPRPDMIFRMEQRRVPEPLLKRRLDYLRAEYDRAYAAPEKK